MSVRSLFATMALVFALLSLPAHAVEPDEMLADPALEARAREVTRELRCVVCQNQSVDDSDAPLARDIRMLVRERVKSGDTNDQVRDYIVARYGKFVLLRPPLDSGTILLWFGPLILVLAAGGIAGWYMRGLGKQTAAPAPLSEAEEQAVRQKLDGTAQ